jgi:DEAD/DEAH box helicase domain-containing protein
VIDGYPDVPGAQRGAELLARVLAGVEAGESPVTHVVTLPARAPRFADWPEWAAPELREACAGRGVERPWSHQVAAADAAHRGQHTVIATGTASGKSLAYQLPVLSALRGGARPCGSAGAGAGASALYLSPTKALATDQLRGVEEIAPTGIRAARYDGDTPKAEREWARGHANWVFTNPDMLHRGVLPAHARWARFFRGLAYVVVDECHGYRGLHGSHVAWLLRRLRRVARHYGAAPTFVLASATVAEPETLARALTGLDVAAVTEDGSPRGERTIALWEPPVEEAGEENAAAVRRSAGAEAGRIVAELVVEGAATLAFVRSRRGAEFAALGAQRLLADVDPALSRRVAAYRGGFLPEERRALEQALHSGALRGVATTNALELGVDIAGLDAVVVAGYPGTRAAFWQQAGRAGRAGAGSLVIFVAADDPLDTYLVHHPAALVEAPLEAAVLDPANPYVARPQLCCAAAELPLSGEDPDWLGGRAAAAAAAELEREKLLRRRPAGWYWASPERPHAGVDIRGSGGEQVAVVEADSARLLGSVDPARAPWAVHPGAVYLHQGRSFVVDQLDLDSSLALVHAEDPDFSTAPQEVTDIAVLGTQQQQRHGTGNRVARTCLGEVEVTSQVIGYLRRLPSGVVLDHVPLDLPPRVLRTKAVWFTASAELLSGSAPMCAGLEPARVPGALHAAEHAAIGLLPLHATCDRWDVGGVSTALHADTGEATVFVHDGHPGGSGFADRGFSALVPWLATTRQAIYSCVCSAGCPSCVQSPNCGSGNEPLDKAGAVAVLDAVLSVVGDGDPGTQHGQD